ncbi:MAG TPA: cellulose synthase subunit BcsC-related outer membrane protein [Gallionella sp.]|nr:cellulose synthase subunit BcsC-related outer membrane protein [Gallionella sp.]
MSMHKRLSPLALGLILNTAFAPVRAETAPVSSSVIVQSFRITGSRAFSETELLKLVDHAVGRQLSRDELIKLADSITGFYRRHGFPRAHAIIPPQNFDRGIVRFQVTTAATRTAGERTEPNRADVSLPPNSGSTDPVQILLEHAQWWVARDRADLAQESLDKLFSIAPDHPSALSLQADIAIRHNRLKEAQAALTALRRAQADHPDIHRIDNLLHALVQNKDQLRHARSLVKAGRYEEAVAIFNKLFPDGPPSDDLTLEYWQMVANTPKGWHLAHQGLIRLVKNNPDNLHYRLALAEHETSRLPIKRRALQIIVEMSKLPGYSQQARNAWRSAMMKLGDTPASLPLLRHYLSAEPNDSAVREKQVLIVQAQARHNRLMADPDYRAGIEGLALLDKGELNAAEPLLQQALRARPADGDLIGGMGMLRLRQGRHSEARENFTLAARHTRGGSRKWSSLVKVAKFWQLMQEARDSRKAGDDTLAENKLNAALQVKKNEPDALAALAGIQADRGQFDAATQTYRHALSIDPSNSEALAGLLTLYRRQGKELEAQQAIAQLSPTQRNALGPTLRHMEASMLQEQAERLLANGQEREAIAVLERAVQADTDDPWLRYTLAKLHARHQQPGKGQALFDELLARHPNDPDALYAMALFQSSQGRSEQVLATLASIPAADRSAKASRLWGASLERIVDAQVQAGHRNEAKRLLRDAENTASSDEEIQLSVAMAWAGIGEYREADRLFDALRSASPSVRWRLRHADYLAMKASPELHAELNTLTTMTTLSPDEKRELHALRESLALRTANTQLAAGEPDLAHQTLAPFLQDTPDHIPLLLAEAQAYRQQQKWPDAGADYAHILRLAPDEADARRGLIETQLAAGNRTAALAQLDAWAGSDTPLSSRLQLVDLYLALDEADSAQELLDSLLKQQPNNPRVLNQAWQMAQHSGRLDEEIVYLQKTLAAKYHEQASVQAVVPAPQDPEAYRQIGFDELGSPKKIRRDWQEKKLAALIDRRSDWFSTAIDQRNRSGTPGTSLFHSTEIPLEYKTPWHSNDEVFFRTDMVRLDAGSVAATNTLFGSQLLCQPLCATNLLPQTTSGMSFTAGYHRDDLRGDIGITPLNFAVTNIVGSLRRDGDIGQLSYSLEASRRPVTSSLLSYAGTRDPRTGQVWGGVVATGGRLGISLDKGEALGFWSSLGLHNLTGRNVLSNQRFQLMAGGQWRIVNEENRLLSLGLTGMYWQHSRNAGEYTFGHGGYYSPQSYRSLSLPVSFGERYPRFSYVLRAAVSASQSQTQAADYYPTDPQLQARAVALTPTNFITPVYAGGPGTGTGYSLKGAWEYQVDPKLFLGGLFSIDRSDNYAPNRALFYLRYSLDQAAAQPVYFQPLPIEPSSQF